MSAAPTASEEMTLLEIRKGADESLEVGGLRFVACRREVDVIDGGITLYVHSSRPGDERELLRFDLFRGRPHYHAPASNPEDRLIDASGATSVAEWGVDQLPRCAERFIGEAGFADLIPKLDVRAISAAGPALRALFARLAEPTELSTFPVPRAQVEALRR